MQQLWAPWRIEFIREPKPDSCFFCDAIAGNDDRAALVLCRNDLSICIMNRYPYNGGHLLIAPKRHEADLERLTPEELKDSWLLVQRAVKILRETMAPGGFNLGANLGQDAGAGVAHHIHFHVVPRWRGDTNFMPLVGDVKVIPQALGELYDELKPKFD